MTILETSEMSIPVQSVTVAGSIEAGFRMNWVTASATDDDEFVEAELCSGAGCGSPYMTLAIKLDDGTHVYERVDVREFLGDWIDSALARAVTREGEE